MPIYEFVCIDCGHKFEYLVRSSSEDITCLHCHCRKLRKLVSSFSFASKDSAGNLSASSSGCSGCSSHNCSTCRG